MSHRRTPPFSAALVLLSVAAFLPPARASAGALVAWGDDGLGQVSGVPEGGDVIAVSGGGAHALALRADGSLAACGSNLCGEAFSWPGHDYIAVAAGGFCNLALKADHSIVAWGDSEYGKLNIPSSNASVAISAGALSGYALTPEPATLLSLGLVALMVRRRY